MVESKVADAKCAAEARRKLGESYQCCSARRTTVSVRVFSEKVRHGNSITRAPLPFRFSSGATQKKRGRENSPELRQSRARRAEARQTQVQSRVESSGSDPSSFLAPNAALMASVLGNSSRASGAQSGQVKCKLKRRRRRRSKRKGNKNFTTLLCFFTLAFLFI